MTPQSRPSYKASCRKGDHGVAGKYVYAVDRHRRQLGGRTTHRLDIVNHQYKAIREKAAYMALQ